MQIGPNGEKRPDDPIARAVMIAKISTGEIEEEYVGEDEAQERPPQSSRPSGSKNRRKAEITPPAG
jgi:hypothetical protein